MGQGQLPQAADTYANLGKLSVRGASLAASGLANLANYEGRYREGAQILQKAAAVDLAAKENDAAADKFVMLAYADIQRGDKQSAVAAAENALANSQTPKIKFLAARSLLDAGDIAKARKLADGLAADLRSEPQGYAKLIAGESALAEHNPRQAIQLFTEAKSLVNIWIGTFDLGRAYLDAGAFAEADAEFDTCIKRRGEAMELFLDDMPTYGYFPPVYYYQGRAREGLKSPGAKESYQTYASIRGKAGEDPLLPNIRQRLSQ
jgi:hypothetical protein